MNPIQCATKVRRVLKYAMVGITLCLIGVAQSPRQASPQPPAQPSPQPQSTLAPIQLDGNPVLHHLNQVVSWYRHATTGIRDVGLPSDTIYEDNAKTLGAQVVQLAFQSAKAESALIAAQRPNAANPSAETTQQQSLDQMKAKTSSQIDQLQSQIDALKAQLPKARGAKRESLVSQRDALESELGLQKARLEAIQKMSAFVESNGEVGH